MMQLINWESKIENWKKFPSLYPYLTSRLHPTRRYPKTGRLQTLFIQLVLRRRSRRKPLPLFMQNCGVISTEGRNLPRQFELHPCELCLHFATFALKENDFSIFSLFWYSTDKALLMQKKWKKMIFFHFLFVFQKRTVIFTSSKKIVFLTQKISNGMNISNIYRKRAIENATKALILFYQFKLNPEVLWKH